MGGEACPRDLGKREKGRWQDDGSLAETNLRLDEEPDQKEECWARAFRVWGL